MTAVQANAAAPARTKIPRPGRIVGLDGIRGLAVLYVVLNHIFERAWPGYPADHALWWAGELIYGRFAVVIFIALSGFSLGLGPARSGWRFDSIATFAHRRAWRILPPYWAALAFSLVMTWCVLAQPGWAVPNGKSVVVYGLLVQDAVSVGSPNRAFWSIAVEAQLYILLPLLLLIVRRVSALAMVALKAAIVVTIGLLGPHVALLNDTLVKFTPDLAVLFAVGVLAAGVVTAGERTRSRPWSSYALAATTAVIVLIWVKGSTLDEHQLVLGRSGLGPGDRLLARGHRHLAAPAARTFPGHAPAAQPRVVLVQPLSHPHADRDRRVVRAGARPDFFRDTGFPRAVCDPAADDGGLRATVRGRVRTAVPAVPGVDPVAAGGDGPAAPARAARAGRRRHWLAASFKAQAGERPTRSSWCAI
jgi:uncharacterized membrane protein